MALGRSKLVERQRLVREPFFGGAPDLLGTFYYTDFQSVREEEAKDGFCISKYATELKPNLGRFQHVRGHGLKDL